MVCGDANLAVPNCTLFEFGVMSSLMHNAWVAGVCGRIKSDFRYSVKIVYNNFPWPKDVSEKHRAAVEAAAKAVLDTRNAYASQSLADLYDPLAMPGPLLQAHRALDRAVDAAYTKRRFASDAERVAYLLVLYKELNDSLQLVAAAKKVPRKRA